MVKIFSMGYVLASLSNIKAETTFQKYPPEKI